MQHISYSENNYNRWIINKMLASSEQVVNYATDSIINNIERSISSLEKVNKNKPVHSARQIFKVLGEISSHISYAADKQLRLTTPKDLNSLRLDSYMSVFNVEANQNPIRHRSTTKNYKKRRGTMDGRQQLFQSFKKKRAANYDKLQALKQPDDIQLEKKRSHNQLAQQELQDKFRAEKQKKQLIIPDVKKKTMPKIVPAQQLKQRFSYDYQSNTIKIKSEIRSSLVHSNKSLKAEISRNVQIKPSLHKIIKPVPTVLKTNLVVEKKKKEKKSRQNAEEPVIEQPVEIQFSKINSLNQMLQCQPGVRFNFNGHTFKSNRSHTQSDSHQNGDNTVIRYSKLDYMLLKKRRSTSLNNLQLITNRSVNKKSSAAQTELEYSQSYHNLTINTQRSSKRKRNEKVQVSNQRMLQYLLTPEMKQKEQKMGQLEREQEQVSTNNIKLDQNDKYNMNYIRGMRNLSINTGQKDFEKTKFPNHQPSKMPFLKVRERLQNKMIFISQLKKKFEETLRTSQQGSNLLEN